MSPIPLRRRRPKPILSESPPWHAPPVDPALLKLQEQLEAIEARRAEVEQAVPPVAQKIEAEAGVLDVDVIIDLDQPDAGEELLDAPVIDEAGNSLGPSIQERIEALERRVVAAENQARSAEARARAAAARAEDILFALPDLAHELRLLVDTDQPSVEQLQAAIDRMRARVAPQPRPTPSPVSEAPVADRATVDASE